MGEMEEEELGGREHMIPIKRDPYSHPNGPNIHLYTARGTSGGHVESECIDRLNKEPETQALQNRERYALRELGLPYSADE